MTTLESVVGAVRTRSGAWNLARGLAFGAGCGALAWALGLPWLAALLIVAGGSVGFAHRLTEVDAARLIDTAAQLDGQLECAWDHRAESAPIALAQRERALAAFAARSDVRVVRPASPLWLLPLAAWAWPLTMSPRVPKPSPPRPAVASADSGAAGSATSAATPSSTIADAGATRSRATARKTDPDAGVAGDGGSGAGSPTAGGHRGGVGERAGDRSGGAAGRAKARIRAGVGPSLVVPRAAGVGVAGGAAGAAAAPLGRAPLDDVADPARPYPRRYRDVVTAWFDRDERGRQGK